MGRCDPEQLPGLATETGGRSLALSVVCVISVLPGGGALGSTLQKRNQRWEQDSGAQRPAAAGRPRHLPGMGVLREGAWGSCRPSRPGPDPAPVLLPDRPCSAGVSRLGKWTPARHGPCGGPRGTRGHAHRFLLATAFFFPFFETGSRYAAQAGLRLLGSGHPPASASPAAGDRCLPPGPAPVTAFSLLFGSSAPGVTELRGP